MRKEIIIAVVAGLAIGLSIAFVIWRENSDNPIVNSALNTSVGTSPEAPAVNPLTDGELIVDGLEDGRIYTQSPITVSGVSPASAAILISTETEDFVTPTEPDNSFSAEIDLNKGVNQITIASFDRSGELINKNVTFTVVYYPEFANDIKLD